MRELAAIGLSPRRRRVSASDPLQDGKIALVGDFIGLVSAEDIAEAETVLAFVRAGSPGRPTRGALRQSPAPAKA